MLALYTKVGVPKPWSLEETQKYVNKYKEDMEKGWHMYQNSRRIWGQKPFEDKKVREKPVVEDVPESTA